MPDQPPRQHPDHRDERKRVGAWIVAMNFAYGVVGSLLLGLLIDWLAGTTPIWTLVLLGAGLIGGGYVFVREALTMNTGYTDRRARVDPPKVSANSNHNPDPPHTEGSRTTTTQEWDQS